MKKFTRADEPQVLIDNAATWNKEYAEKKTANNNYNFFWRTVNGEKLNRMLYPILSLQTQHHCSFCDKYPLDRGDDTIDHFYPKSNPEFYHLVYSWHNLYLACNGCQKSKMEQFDKDLLKPDDMHYQFDEYFQYNYNSHNLEPRVDKSDNHQRKAKVTIEIFGLNHPDLSKARKHAFERFINADEKIIDDYNFRFIL
ncbi:MAG: hypothetical protein QM541_11340 [Flavobacterium sp.]|nr:hypothetical protein [Flavobacterium sp.]